MSTYGTLEIKEENPHFTGDSLKLEAMHDGVLSHSLREFLILPYSIFHQSKWEYENYYAPKEDDPESDQSFLADNTRGFHFYWSLCGDEPVCSPDSFDYLFEHWRDVFFLDIFQSQYMSLWLWQKPNKWIITDSFDRHGPDATVRISKGRMPDVTFEHEGRQADEDSDHDVVGFCVPPKEIVFPHLQGEIIGFGNQKQRFKHFQATQFERPDGKPWDITMFSIVHYFDECMDNNPNWLETLFTPQSCVLTSSRLSKKVRENAELFLHKGCFYRFTGFMRSQIHKMKNKDHREDERRYKYGYHAVRMVDECEQILREGTLVLDDNQEKIRSVKKGEWSYDEIEEYCLSKEEELEELYETSDAVPYEPDERKIKTLLLECLEEGYGSLEKCIRFGKWS